MRFEVTTPHSEESLRESIRTPCIDVSDEEFAQVGAVLLFNPAPVIILTLWRWRLSIGWLVDWRESGHE